MKANWHRDDYFSLNLLASGLNLSTSTGLAPFSGWLVGAILSAAHATVTNSAELVVAVMTRVPVASAEFDGSSNGNTGILCAMRQRLGTVDGLTGMNVSSLHDFFPLSLRVNSRTALTLACQAGSTGGVAQVVLQFVSD